VNDECDAVKHGAHRERGRRKGKRGYVGYPEAVRLEEVQPAETRKRSCGQLLRLPLFRQAQQQVLTTNCAWFRNELNCTAVQ
jgi:hypothetical protein